ncbi:MULTISPECIES: amino acid ABC transporter permease [Brucella]|jgi:general L-amino acid transport system permease protein|uniref:amino acid ABC transporter permease n=1 Tax=Brucella TaxID=234 RepID=UPI0005BB4D8A|nr:ABC transporter permease subunit [Brucella anthropi]MBA8862203.1 general L-amino acid transport system permease protein [Brucella anthropi]MDG9792860.1 ABC transporter permease subunit [Brucella anthropi]MDH0581906.1 ABC transporter permease subunit [Brucella anthropi]MDH0819525.1 ABC transporter permease subunit [Brucella anthropi]MDH2085469.1 ABC transporter permease subunit [Brucella anthropi]
MTSIIDWTCSSSAQTPPRPRGFIRWLGPHPLLQLALIVLLFAALFVLAGNVLQAMHRHGIQPGFGFLFRSANFEIGESSFAFQAGDPYWRAISVGLLNTVKVAVGGIVLSTILGVLIGVAVMLRNPLLGGLLRGYIEIIRNTPLLLQLFFWLTLIQAFPPPRRAFSAFGSFYLSNRGVYVPALTIDLTIPHVLLLTACTIALFLWWRWKPQIRRTKWMTLIVGAAFFLPAVKASSVGITIEAPSLSGFNIRGGHVLSPEFAVLLIGLTVKFSATIAEIVRAGIQSVNQGQWEAARALGLHNNQIFRLIVLPQALRVITPMMTSCYLDLTKDSSLAVAIGYPDLVSIINTTSNTTGQSLEALALLVGVYVVLNIAVSIAMNIYNRRVALRGQLLK